MTIDPRAVIRSKVAEAIYTDSERLFPDAFPWSKLSAPEQDGYRKLADAAIAAHLEALDEANTIRTVEQLDALGLNSIVRTEDGDTWEKRTYLSGLWDRLTEDGNGGLRRPPLPCRALYRPRGA